MEKSPKVVNDTNVWLSALYFSGKPSKIVNCIEEKEILSFTSEFILQEVQEKMVDKFHAPMYAANGTIAYITSLSKIVPLKGKTFGLRDSSDERVLETAVAGNCQYLITGDKDLLILRRYDQVKIVTPDQFLDEIG